MKRGFFTGYRIQILDYRLQIVCCLQLVVCNLCWIVLVIFFGSILDTELHAQEADNMIHIQAGRSSMGTPYGEGEKDEHPPFMVFLDAYYMDKYEVTKEDYKRFLEVNPAWQKRGSKASVLADADYLKDWLFNNYIPGMGKHPVVWVSWHAAEAYCKWAGKRLPTEAEWEKAASWDEGSNTKFKYPWGNGEPDCNYANYNRCYGQTTEVGSLKKAKSPYRLFDMAGNVSEWVADWYNKGYYQSGSAENPKGPDNGRERVYRGGSWDENSNLIRSTNRFKASPILTTYSRGFRCAR